MFEGFTDQETNYEKALDRANPLAANENSLINKIPIGISKGNGIIQRLMHQTALNIPTSVVSENGVSFLQGTSDNANTPIYPRIDNENSFLGLSKFCKDNAVGETPFDNNTFKENCGICLSSGSLADGTPFTGETGIVVYKKDKDIFTNEKTAKRHPFTRAIPSIKDGSKVSCNDSSKGPDAKPVLAINQSDYRAFKDRAKCVENKELGNGCGVCLNNNTISYINTNGNFKSRTLYLWGSGNATLAIAGSSVGSSTQLDITTPASYDLGSFKEGAMVELTVTGPSCSVYGAFISRTPSDGKYVLAIDKFLLSDMANNGTFPRSGGSKSVTIENVAVNPLQLRAQTGSNNLRLQGYLPLTFVDSDQLAAYDCPNAPFITNQDASDIFGVGGPCIIPTGQGRGKYTDECLKDTLTSAGCSTGGKWYSDLDTLRADMTKNGSSNGDQSLAELTTFIKAGSSTDKDFQLKCYGVDLTTPCDDYLQSGNPNKACLTYLYNGGDSKWTQRELGPIYSGASAGDKCTAAGSLNPNNDNSDLFAEARNGIDAVKKFLTDTLQRARGNLNINKSDEDGGRNTSYNMCIGPSPMPTPPADPPSPAPPDPPRNPSISTATINNNGRDGIMKASWGTPVNKGANATGITSYTIILYGKIPASENFDEIKKFYNIYGNSADLSYTGLLVYEKWYFTITAKNDKGVSSQSVQSNTYIAGESNAGPCPASVIIRPNGTYLSKASEVLSAYADIYPNGDYNFEWTGGPNTPDGNPTLLNSGKMGSTRADNLGMLKGDAPPNPSSWNYKLKVTNPGCEARESAIRVQWY